MAFYLKHYAARFAFCSSFCRFSWKSGVKDRNDDVKCVDVTVFDYFVNHRRINLCFSGDFPWIDVGKPRKPTYIPIEVT